MRTIPSAVQTLLKSRSMIGANKPSYEVTVEGLGGGYDYDTIGDTWRVPVSTIDAGGLSLETKTDGSIIVCGMQGGEVYEGTVADVDTLLGADNTVTGWATTGITTNAYGRCCVFRANNELWLSVFQLGSASVEGFYKLYKSASGNGGDWALFSTVWQALTGTPSISPVGNATAGTITVLSSGRFVLCGPYISTDNGASLWHTVWVSGDSGLTWVEKWRGLYGPAGGAVSWAGGSSRTVADVGGTLYFGYGFDYGGAGTVIKKSVDFGETWVTWTILGVTAKVGGSFYAAPSGNVLIHLTAYLGSPGVVYIHEYDPAVSTEHTLQIALPPQVERIPTEMVEMGNALIIVGGISVLSAEILLSSLPVKSISISRNKNTAGQLTLVVDNKGGEWAPDGTAHLGILWPNKQIGLWQGYSTELVKTFTGTIDSVALSTFPQELTLNLRDHLKYALDQIITNGTSHVLTYTAQTIEAIVTDLVSKASMTAGTIHATGITIATKTFSWCTYADAIQELAELAGGYEYGCDEDGLFYFRKDANVSPLAKGWTLTFASGAAQTLYFPIISGSEKIYSGATVYVKDTDYTINYTTGAITSITIAGGPVTMDYAYISYEFAEGEDIISLGYTLDDEAAYYKVAVYGQAADGHAVFASADFASRTYYNVLPQKFMKIDAGESAQTVAECQALADQAISLMESRIRICTFAAVAVPWLQVGDFIRVTETSTTISEIYRITDLSTSMDDSGYTMSITCFHHSA